MDSGLRHASGLIGLRPDEVLRVRDAAGRPIGVVRDVEWVTQEGNPRDFVLGSGESMRLERGGDTACFERRARQLRAEAIAQAVAALTAGLKALWRRIGRSWKAAARARKTAGELRLLNDRTLRDIGLRRDQVDCIARLVPC